MWIKKVELSNFQSHENTVVEFCDKSNCIVGPTRAGKTSIIRALAFVFFDEWYPDYARKKTECTTVTVYLSTGCVVSRSKGEKINKIVVHQPGKEDQVFEKFGIEAPAEVKNILGMFPVKIDSDIITNINLGQQDDPPFLLSESTFMKTKFLNRLTGLHIIDIALRQLGKDKVKLQDDCQFHKESLDKLTQQVHKFDKIVDIYNQVEPKKEIYNSVRTKLEKYKQLVEYFNLAEDLSKKSKDLRTKIEKMSEYVSFGETLFVKFEKMCNLILLKEQVDKQKDTLNLIRVLNSEEKNLLQKYSICPLCRQNIQKEA